uniref:Uncharacterized protein n=1 Tax=Meloidogyne enterolobii TaxID=390850 RepID=A0A6V7WHI6_MELEN|nr:unnamed protein product [Meloidogyne enterolobii]
MFDVIKQKQFFKFKEKLAVVNWAMSDSGKNNFRTPAEFRNFFNFFMLKFLNNKFRQNIYF